MKNITPLNNVDHKDLKVDTMPCTKYGDNTNRTLAYASEIADLHKELPLLIFRDPDSNALQIHAIMGLDKDENLFLTSGGWSCRYIPAALARGPFCLGYHQVAQNGESHPEAVLCADLTDARFNTEKGENLFLEFGGDSAYLKHVKKALQVIESGQQYNNTLFKLVEDMELLEPVSIQIKLGDEAQINFTKYFTINHTRLTELDGNSLATLSKYGVLSLLYYLLSSMSNFQRLIDLKNAKTMDELAS